MHSTLPELSNPGPLCHNDKKAAREWAVQARYTQARLAKGRGVCSACRPAQRSLHVQTAQRGLGVQTALAGRGFVDQVAINTNAPGADGCDRHSGREKQCPRYAAGSDGGGGEPAVRDARGAHGDLGQGPSPAVVRRYNGEWTARVVTSPSTETQLERFEEASPQQVGRGGRGRGGQGLLSVSRARPESADSGQSKRGSGLASTEPDVKNREKRPALRIDVGWASSRAPTRTCSIYAGFPPLHRAWWGAGANGTRQQGSRLHRPTQGRSPRPHHRVGPCQVERGRQRQQGRVRKCTAVYVGGLEVGSQ